PVQLRCRLSAACAVSSVVGGVAWGRVMRVSLRMFARTLFRVGAPLALLAAALTVTASGVAEAGSITQAQVCAVEGIPLNSSSCNSAFNALCTMLGGFITGEGSLVCNFNGDPISGSLQARQALGLAASQASLVGTAAVQSEIANIRDRLQRGSGPPAQGPSGLGAPSGLGYGADWDNPRMGVTRAYQPPPGQPLPFATWVLGFADHESRDSNPGFVDGRTTNTEGA